MPLVQQVTFVLSKKLKVYMKDIHTSVPYTLEVAENQAVLTPLGTFLQLINCTDLPCDVLSSSAHRTFLIKKGTFVLYDDSICFDEDWKALADWNWQPPRLREANLNVESRYAVAELVASRKRNLYKWAHAYDCTHMEECKDPNLRYSSQRKAIDL